MAPASEAMPPAPAEVSSTERSSRCPWASLCSGSGMGVMGSVRDEGHGGCVGRARMQSEGVLPETDHAGRPVVIIHRKKAAKLEPSVRRAFSMKR